MVKPPPDDWFAHAYDPVKAREYYLKTRKLKGRKRGSAQPVGISVATKAPAKGLPAKKKLTPQELAQKRKAAAERVQNIKKKLAELNTRLKEKMAEAREAEAKAKRGPTAAEKAEAARESKQYRDKNKQKLANKANGGGGDEKKAEPKVETVESLKQTIAKVQGQLTAAIERQRALG